MPMASGGLLPFVEAWAGVGGGAGVAVGAGSGPVVGRGSSGV